jgi:RNA-binding protein YlmH
MYDESAILGAARDASESGVPVLLGFLDEDEQDMAARALAPIGEVTPRFYGGYRGAIRKRLVIMPSNFIVEVFDAGISYFALRGDGLDLSPSSDPDIAIGEIRALGIPRDHIGDVFYGGNEWQGVVLASIFGDDYGMKRQEGSGVKLVELDAAEILFPGATPKKIRATAASMRLDAVAGAGFPASRSRLAQEIRAGRFKVNGEAVDSPSAKISEGDIIVCHGRGRLVVEEVLGETRRGRISLLLTRYSANMPFS